MRTPTPEQRSLTLKPVNGLKSTSINVLCKRSYEGAENEGPLKRRSPCSPQVSRKIELLRSASEVGNLSNLEELPSAGRRFSEGVTTLCPPCSSLEPAPREQDGGERTVQKTSPSPERGMREEDLEALRMLESSELVRQASTKNFVALAAHITVTRSSIEGLDLLMAKKCSRKGAGALGVKLTFTGNPIEQLAKERMKDPNPFFEGSHAEAVLLTRRTSNGSIKVTGQSLHFAIKFIEDEQFFGSSEREQKNR